ncbi:MAG TPA: EMC3/TMCO1 family protein [Methanothrix sp.]|uniref:DUF106 domain-containing protein n=1 Tax=Methanothrix sp. TaxID=90426 RepID=UPI002CF60CE8|nr:EMC3/TMCO1 family protein [Methanothrix sp.]MDI9416651.1 EMC3/TMCO1 family protein [Euryarchaeota archaeon]HON36036.1 EMC3/TMCO1 family protein [Methanothrix sp.]HRU75709.1 EMC3/TMCO1 family protein [Methanothrix sp.]
MKQSMSSSLDRVALIAGILLFFGVMVEDYRSLLGQAMDHILGWLPQTGLSFPVILFILAAITGLYASLVQKYTMDWEFMRRQQEKMRALQSNMRAAQLAGDQAKIQSLQTEQMKMVSEQGKMMQMQFKPMLYIGIISIPLFMWIYFYIKSSGGIMMTFPFWGPHNIQDMVLGPILYWFYWYFVCSLPVSQIIRKALDIGSMS